MGLGEFVGISIGPVGVEIRVGVLGAAGVAVIARAVRCELTLFFPGCSLIFADPDFDFAAGTPFLRAGAGGADDSPGAVVFDVKSSGVVVVGGGGDGVEERVFLAP